MSYCPGIETRSSQCLWTGLGLTGWGHVFVLAALSSQCPGRPCPMLSGYFCDYTQTVVPS